MKKLFIITALMTLGVVAIAQEIIQQPSALNLYNLDNEGQEHPFFNHVVFQYDSMGRLISLYRSTNNPGITIYNKTYEYDSFGNLIKKRCFNQDGAYWNATYYFYAYDSQSHLVEYYVAFEAKYEYWLGSRQVYEYSNDTLAKIYYYYADIYNT